MSPQIATNTVVSRDELADFVRPRHHAIVITVRPGQFTVVQTPVWASGLIVTMHGRGTFVNDPLPPA